MAEVPMTELEAINLMLATIGEAPVDNLDVTGLIELSVAKTKLTNINRNVQSRGWWFNSETNYPMVPHVSTGEIALATNILKIDTTPRSGYNDIVERNRKLYDKTDHTFVFDKTLYCDITWYFPFDELPHAARWYIAIAAARRFQKAMVGSETLDAFTAEDEKFAYASMLEAETDSGDYNIAENLDTQSTIYRHFNIPR